MKNQKNHIYDHWAYVVMHNDTIVGIFGSEDGAIKAADMLESHLNELVDVRKGRFFYDIMPLEDAFNYVTEVKPLKQALKDL